MLDSPQRAGAARSSHLDVGAIEAWTAGLTASDAAGALAALGVTIATKGARRASAGGDLPAVLDTRESVPWTIVPILDRDGGFKPDALARFDAAGLAAGWRAFARPQRWQDEHIPSLAIKAGTLDLASCAWLTARLSADWIGRGSFIDAADLGSGPAFRWPLRVGLLGDEASRLLRAELEGPVSNQSPWLRGIVEFVEPQGPETPIEILLTPGSLEDVMSVAAADRHGFEAASVIALGGLGDRGAGNSGTLRDDLLRSIDPSAVAVATVPAEARGRWFRDLVETFSHDQTLDVAMQTATRGVGGTPTLVVADSAALSSMRVQSAAMRAIDDLPKAGPGRVVLPPAAAASLGYGNGIDPYVMDRAVLTGQFTRPQMYDHETHGATNVSTLNRLTEARWDEPMAAALPPPTHAKPPQAGNGGEPHAANGGPRAPGPVKPPTPVRIKPRFILAQVWERRRGAPRVRRQGRLQPRTRHDLDVRIGSRTRGWLSGTAPVDLTEVTRDGDRHRLRVIFAPDGRRKPQVHSVLIPAAGTSTTCTFRLDTPASGTIRGRIIVEYRNRVLQTALLTGAVQSTRGLGRSPLKVTTESIVRPTFQRLSRRRPFDLAIVHNHGEDGKPGATAIHGPTVISVPMADVDKDVVTIRAWLTATATDPAAYAGLTKKATVELLYKLARRGIGLRRLVVDAADSKGLGDPLRTPRIQVVAAKQDSVFPIEFFYDFPAPTTAVLCPNAEIALRDGHCDPSHHGKVAKDGSIGVVCPMGFWSMNRVIERHAPAPESAGVLEGSSFAAVNDDKLAPLASAMFAWSDRVKAKDANLVSAAMTTATDGHLTKAVTWDAWLDAITDTAPDLLVLLSHSDKEAVTGEAELVIAKTEARASGLFGPPYVRVKVPPTDGRPPRPGPLVFLLGCDTAAPWSEYQSFAGVFRYCGAVTVVGTIATVAASHAANVARRLVDRVAAQAPKPAAAAGAKPKGPARPKNAFGDVLLLARRELLADGEVMALTITSYGDSDLAFG